MNEFASERKQTSPPGALTNAPETAVSCEGPHLGGVLRRGQSEQRDAALCLSVLVSLLICSLIHSEFTDCQLQARHFHIRYFI